MSSESRGRLGRYLGLDSDYRLVSAITTPVVQEACERHGLTGLAAIALGRAMTAAQLMATMAKGDAERLTLQIRGDGPMRGLTVDARGNGETRGYVSEAVEMPASDGGRVSVKPVVGRVGTITVHRDLGMKDIYQGHGELVQGEVDEDVEGYMRQSEQVPTALGCDVRLDKDGKVIGAIGVMLQAMPGTREQEGDPVREAQHLLRTGLLHVLLREDEALDLDRIANDAAPGHMMRRMGERELYFHCPCSRERLMAALVTLGPDELQSMIDDDHGAEATCPFCSTTRTVSEDELAAIRARILGQTH